MVGDICPLPRAGQNRPFPLFPLCPQLQKLFLHWGLKPKKLLVLVDAVVGLDLFATTLAAKHMTTVLSNYVLVRHSQRLESLVTYITGVNLLSLVSPQTDPIQQQHWFPHKPAFDIFRSRCIPLQVLLKANPSPEGNDAVDKADVSACHQLGQVNVLHYFWGKDDWLHGLPICVEKGLTFLTCLPQLGHCSGKQGRVASGRWSGALEITRLFMVLGLSV